VSKLGLRSGEKDNFGLKGLARVGPKIKLVFTQHNHHVLPLLFAVAFKRNRSKINTNGEAL